MSRRVGLPLDAPARWRRIEPGYYVTRIDGHDWKITGPAGTLADGLRMGKYRLWRDHEPVGWAKSLADAKQKILDMTKEGK